MVLGDPRQPHQRTQSFHFPSPFINHSYPAAQAPSSLSLHALEHSTGSERVEAFGGHAVEVIICMITRDFSVISIDVTSVSLSLSLSLSLYFSQKSLTHNIGSASALPIILKNQEPDKDIFQPCLFLPLGGTPADDLFHRVQARRHWPARERNKNQYHHTDGKNNAGPSQWGRAHYVMVSRIQWKPFWLATQLYPQNDWTGWQNGVNNDVCAQAPFRLSSCLR